MFESASRMAATACRAGGFLARLARDRRGNTLVIIAAALFPLAAMIGSGVDMSRAYMAKQRLQSACDAAALAGRRVMQNDTMTTAVEAEAVRFFRFNFPQNTVAGSTPARVEGPYATEGVVPTVTRPAPGTVRVTASTRIPTTVMKMFGFTTLPLTVTCDAALNFVNTDVMLVLDTTGSMFCLPSEPGTCGRTSEVAGSRIVGLRAAVIALYRELRPTQTQLELNGLRLRYGIVPYSSSVNVGRLITAADTELLPLVRNSMRDLSPYQAREYNYNTAVYIAVDTPVTAADAALALNPGVQRFRTGSPASDRLISNANCTNFINNNGFSQTVSGTTGGTFTATGVNNDNDIYDPDGAAGLQANAPTNAPTGYVRYQFSRNTATWSGTPTNRVCDRNVTVTRRSYITRYRYSNSVRYIQSQFDTSQLRGGSTTLATNTNGTVATQGWYNDRALALSASTTATVHTGGTVPGIATTSVNWTGCIEERDTTSTINTSTDLSIPDDALDLNINLIPTAENERWRPHWPRVVYRRDTNALVLLDPTNANDYQDMNASNMASSVACPVEAKRMQPWATEAAMQIYVNSLTPIGGTYHDIGMIWGARMLSNAGIFAADNPDVVNFQPVTRHIIFMTDGELAPNCNSYTSYGIEQNDRRVTNSFNCTDQDNRHMQRFHMACDQARGMGFNVWVIAFGTALTDDMRACASNVTQAYAAVDTPSLIARFREIGANIGALRLTQ